jgi:soluble lytic murein transglycosylase
MLGRYREPVRAWTDPVGRALFRLRLRPNHLTVIGLGVSIAAASAFVAGRTRSAGLLLLAAGLCDFFDGALARVSGQVTAFGAFLDSVIDRYSDLVVMLGIVVFYARAPHARGAVVAMAGLIGSMMVSYTKARAESIGVRCTVGIMERPERLICLIAGAILDLLEPALWVLAILSNLTALQRIAFTWRAARGTRLVRGLALAALLLLPGAAAAAPPAARPAAVTPELERAWAQAVEAYQRGEAAPLIREFGAEAARESPIGDYLRYVLAEALTQRGDLAGARATAAGVADRWRESPLAPRALLLAATLAQRAGDDAGAQALLARLVDAHPEAPEVPEALYLLATSAETRGQRDLAAQIYRQLQLVLPASGYADGAEDRLGALAASGVRPAPFTLGERLQRAERLLRGGVPGQAADEADRIVADARDGSIVFRALRIAAEAAKKLGRWEFAARALELALPRAAADQKPALQLERARLLARAGQRQQALALFTELAGTGTDVEAAEALYQRARLLDEMDRGAEALDAYRQVAARFPSREVAAASLWRLGWLAWLQGDARGAAGSWARAAEPGGDRAWRLPVLYWSGRAREQLGERAAAERCYAQVLAEAPRTYYGVLAAGRAAAPPRSASAGVTLPAEPAQAVRADPAYARAELLRRIGLVEYAVQELEEQVPRAAADPARLYGLSSVYVKEERYHLALRVFRRYLAPLAASGDPALPRAFWEMFYPFAWRAELTDAATAAGLDPHLVAAVVREESSYYPRAVSRAGARGLMQLMPGTAQPMASVRGLAFRNGALLDDPAQNLRIGARFLAGLVREFGDPRLALAAYNAGPKRVRQWWSARRTDDVEAFVEQIPFDETRHYVKRVVLSWDEYRRLYRGR